jgi:hypothetical protein
MSEVTEFKISFNSLALITGGLHPTTTGCMQNADTHGDYNGRWRNGSLTMHLVKDSHFINLGATESALDRLIVQTPVDFQEAVYLTNGDGIALTKDLDNNGIIDGTGPAYEIYGGLHADTALPPGQNGFLYESTMFWHFSGACYGQPTWAADYLRESQYSVYEIFYEQLDRAGVTTLEELAVLIDGLLASGCATLDGGNSGNKNPNDVEPVDSTSCQAEYDELQETYALGLLLEANGETINCGADGCLGDGSNDDGTGDGSGTSNSTEPLTVISGIDESGITSGPNFTAGRRTWIDILPE